MWKSVIDVHGVFNPTISNDVSTLSDEMHLKTKATHVTFSGWVGCTNGYGALQHTGSFASSERPLTVTQTKRALQIQIMDSAQVPKKVSKKFHSVYFQIDGS